MGNFKQGSRFGGSRFGGRRDFSDRGSERTMYKAVCDNCGRDCEVPFQPTSGKPVFCSDCFKKRLNAGGDRPERRDSGRDFNRDGRRSAQNEQLEVVNAKLDKILRMLEGNKVITETKEEVTKPKLKAKKKVTTKKKSVSKKK